LVTVPRSGPLLLAEHTTKTLALMAWSKSMGKPRGNRVGGDMRDVYGEQLYAGWWSFSQVLKDLENGLGGVREGFFPILLKNKDWEEI